jgi:hypothetical protein
VATVHDAIKETIRAHLTLVHVFHVYASADTLWVAHALSPCTPIMYGRIASILVTHDATKFAGANKSPMCWYIIKCLFDRAQLTRSLINIGRGYHRGAPNL